MTTQNNYISQPVPALVRMFFERCHSSAILPGISCECYDCEWYIESGLFCCSIGLEDIEASANAVVLSAIRDAARRWLWENAIVDFCNRSDYGTTGNFIRLALPQLPVFAAKSIGDVFDPSDTVALLAACLMVKDEMEKGK